MRIFSKKIKGWKALATTYANLENELNRLEFEIYHILQIISMTPKEKNDVLILVNKQEEKMAAKTFVHASSTDSERSYITSSKEVATITLNQNFDLELTIKNSTDGLYQGINTNSTMTLTNGQEIVLEADKTFTTMCVDANGSAVLSPGGITIVETGNVRVQWRIRSCTLDDAANPTTAVFILERVDDPMQTMTWTGITVS